MTSPIETNNVVERAKSLALAGDFSPDDLGGDIGTMSLRNPDGPELLSIVQSLSDRIDVLAKLAGDVRWKELGEGAPFTVTDRMMLRDLYAAGQASLTQGGKTNG